MPKLKKPLPEQNGARAFLVFTAVACAVNLIVFLVLHNINFIHFEMNDDFGIQNLLNGSMGEYYTHFVHTNAALSSLLAGLYRLNAAVNWYGVFLFAALFASSALIGGILMDKFRLKLGLSLYLATVPLLFGLILTRFTYTTVGYAMLAAALCCLIYGFYSENKTTRRMLLALSVFGLVLCVLLRKEVLANALVYCAAFAVLTLMKYRGRALALCLSVLVSLAAIGCFLLADDAYYRTDSELSEYKRFHEARINLVDHAQLNYALYPGAFGEIGWTETDAATFAGYLYPDEEKFNVENLEYIYAFMRPTRYNTGDVSGILRNLVSVVHPAYHVNSGYILIALFTSFSVAFLSQRKKLFRAFAVFLAALPFLFQILFNILLRVTFRTVYPPYMISILLLLTLIDVQSIKDRMETTRAGLKSIVSAAAVCIACMFGVGFCALMLDEAWNHDEKMADPNTQATVQAFEAMSGDPGNAYLYPIASPLTNANLSYDIFHAFPRDYFLNSRPLGGWDTRSPSYNDFKERYGLSSLPVGVINKEGAYLVTPDASAPLNYMINAYGKELFLEPVAELAPGIWAERVVG